MEVAVIGAGLAGLTTAFELKQQGIGCEVIEKSRTVGGRMNSRRVADCVIDDGAQYFTVKSPEFAAFLRQIGLADRLHRLAAPVVAYPFSYLDEALAAALEDEARLANSGLEYPFRYSFAEGMDALPTALAEQLDPEHLNLQTYAEGIRWNVDQQVWDLHTRGDNTTLGGQISARSVVISLPAPQAAQLLKRSFPLPAPLAELAEALDQVTYYPCLTVLLRMIRDYQLQSIGGLRAEDYAHPIGWMAWIERLVPGRMPESETGLVIQLTPNVSERAMELPDDQILSATIGSLEQEFGMSLPTVRWIHIKRWRYANPTGVTLDPALREAAEKLGIYLCGDYLERGRIESAFWSGRKLARRIVEMTR
ncbi:MAG TPA: FAD-dependent oxidoreductase [Acidobacteriota bacterium]|nr:FAD-dependent oxidoreductase [Acidobacteriota bacterium]